MSIKVIKNKLAFRKQSKMEAEILKRVRLYRSFVIISSLTEYKLYRRVPRDQRHSLLTLHDTFDHKNHLCLVLELLSVNLYELLGQNGFRGLPLPLVQTISKQLLETLVLLRSAKIIHCDIKPENILLKEYVCRSHIKFTLAHSVVESTNPASSLSILAPHAKSRSKCTAISSRVSTDHPR